MSKGVKMLLKTRNFLKKRSPEILTGIAVAGVISTTIFAVRATPKAMEVVEIESEDKDLTVPEIIKHTWKFYMPAVIMGGVTIVCIISANKISLKRNTALASMYAISERTLKNYQNKVLEVVGEKTHREIRDSIVDDEIKNNPVSKSSVIITGKGNVLCYDCFGGRYFESDIEKIKQAVNELNRDILSNMDHIVTLNELYDKLGLDSTKLGDDVGWFIDDGLVEVDFSSHLAEDGTPCLALDFTVKPTTIDIG